MSVKNYKNILQLNHHDAKKYFLRPDKYCSVDLPKYYSFDELLSTIDEELRGMKQTRLKTANSLWNSKGDNYLVDKLLNNPSSNENMNVEILTSKDGKYSFRSFTLINPILYVDLVQELTTEENWKTICDRFSVLHGNDKIQCISMPIIGEESSKNKKKDIILNWWDKFEQQSLELALDFEYFFQTDISTCYPNIYTHTIAWAVMGKEESKCHRRFWDKQEKKFYLGNFIDNRIQNLQNGQTNGIPQGSALMDFIAEMVLGYADLCLTEEITEFEEKNNVKFDYEILRYRDDYRIFCNDKDDLLEIGKILTVVLQRLNFSLNSSKTSVTEDIVKDSIKKDKYYNLLHPVSNNNLQKRLLIIYDLSQKYPNSGSLSRELTQFYQSIKNRKSFERDNVLVLISILTSIALKAPKCYPIFTGILSVFLNDMTEECKIEILNKITKKFDRVPSTRFLRLWLQRLFYKIED